MTCGVGLEKRANHSVRSDDSERLRDGIETNNVPIWPRFFQDSRPRDSREKSVRGLFVLYRSRRIKICSMSLEVVPCLA